MARKKIEVKNSKIQILVGLIIIGLIVFLGADKDFKLLDGIGNVAQEDPLEEIDTSNDTAQNPSDVTGNLIVDFIDVGQGDSILIRQGSHAMLIDGGTSECKDDLLQFLKNEKVEKFDYIIGTHPHEDHIGSLDDVVNAYDFDNILFPKVTTTTKTFENLVLAVSNKGKQFIAPKFGEEYTLGDAKFIILAPNNDSYASLNNYSIVIKMTYGNNTFLFTGDAESVSESEILDKTLDIKADVLKIGHHGSTTSTSKKFLDTVSPKYAVISVGKDNLYNHPTKTTMDKLSDRNIPVYRTDEQGTIECISNGSQITFNVDPGDYDYMGG